MTLATALLVVLAACGSAATGSSDSAPAAAVATATPPASMDMSTMTAAAPAAAGAATAAAPASGAAAANAVQVTATVREWAIDLSQTEVAAGPVHFVINNTGHFPHNFTIKDQNGVLAATPNFASAQGPQAIDVTLKPGTYTVYCSLPGHADRGQKNTLVVK